MHFNRIFVCLLFSLSACMPQPEKQGRGEPAPAAEPFLVVLGTLQDGGSPHAGCLRSCCHDLPAGELHRRRVVSLGIVDPRSRLRWLVEATPDLPRQLKMLHGHSAFAASEIPDGILLTHAHMGHYAGLLHLGKEAAGASAVPVWVMPRMRQFLESNAPWNLLVSGGHIALRNLAAEQAIGLSPQIRVTPYLVPHRDELSETVCFLVEGPRRKALFLPDIDRWEQWDRSIVEWIGRVDYAFVDATFYDGSELKTRDLSAVPHPFVAHSMALFSGLPEKEKGKVHFIHFNHTNPLLDTASAAARRVRAEGFRLAETGALYPL
jgi:pyrroloquinoline quinone biosynthesis protein B